MSKAPPGGATIKDAQRSDLNLFCRLEAELRCQAHNSWVSSSSSIGRPPVSPSPPVPHSSVITSARSGAVRGARLVARPPLVGVALVPAPAVLLLPAALLRAPFRDPPRPPRELSAASELAVLAVCAVVSSVRSLTLRLRPDFAIGSFGRALFLPVPTPRGIRFSFREHLLTVAA